MKKIVSLIHLTLVQNWQGKLLAFAVTLFLWFFHQLSLIEKTIYQVPFEIINLSSQYTFIEPPPRFLEMEIAGRQESLKFSTEDLKYQIDLKNAEEGSRQYKAILNRTDISPHIQLLNPEVNVRLELEKKSEKKIPIELVVEGNLPSDLDLKKIELKTDSVKIRGRHTVVESTNMIRTEPLFLAEVKQSRKMLLRLIVPSGIEISEKNIEVYVETVKGANLDIERVVTLPLEIKSRPENFSVDLSHQKVRLVIKGDREAVMGFKGTDISAYLDLSKLTHETPSKSEEKMEGEFPVLLSFPQSKKWKVESYEPETVHIVWKVSTPDHSGEEEEIENEAN